MTKTDSVIIKGTHLLRPLQEPQTHENSSQKTRGRPKGAVGKKSLQREPSQFEHALPKKRGRPVKRKVGVSVS